MLADLQLRDARRPVSYSVTALLTERRSRHHIPGDNAKISAALITLELYFFLTCVRLLVSEVERQRKGSIVGGAEH